MPKPGTVNNPKGRPKGSKNRATTDLRLFIKDFLEHNVDTLEKDFKKLSPKDRLNLLEKLLKYAIPVKYDGAMDVSFASLLVEASVIESEENIANT